MTQVLARMRVGGKHFEILVDVDKAVEFKKTGEGDVGEVLENDVIFTDSKQGERASEKDLQDAFGTSYVNEVAGKIIKQGDIQVPAEFREKEREGKVKQVIDFLVRNAVDPSGRPYTPERIETALGEAGVNISNKPIESQITEIVSQISKIIPIKVETKKLIISIPAQYTGQAYGLVQSYKESEEWLDSGELKVTINIPVGLQMDFYDKLNSITHGDNESELIKTR